MFSTIRSRLLVAFLAVAGVVLIGTAVGLAGIEVLAGRLQAVNDRAWPMADMCMEFWIGSLSKNHAADRYADGERELALEELEWARRFVGNSLSRMRSIEKAGKIPAASVEELARLDQEVDQAVDRLMEAADRERALAGDEPARDERRTASLALDAALLRVERFISPVEEEMDLAMDRAAAEVLGVAVVTRWIFLLVALSGLACAVVAGAGLTAHIVQPLRRLTVMAGRIAEGRLNERAGIARQDELGELARSLDRMAVDLSASKDQLIASETRYRSLFEHARDGVIVLDRGGAILEANDAFARMVERDRQSLRGGPFREHLPPADRDGLPDRLSLMVGPAHGLTEMDLTRETGGRVPAEAGAVRLLDGRTVVTLRDLTQRRRMEQALIQGEKLSAIGQLAAGVAHELRNPLFVISNVLYDLGETLGSGRPEVGDDLRIAAEENRRAREIIDNLLEFARPAEGRPGVLEIDAAIRQVIRLFRESLAQRRIDLRTALDARRPCRFHPDAFKQVMVNLLSNAIDAMPQGGRLTVTSRALEDRHVEVRVEDTGVGIPPERQKEIFNPFYSTKEPGRGTGLGLWIVHQTVQRYQGRISVDSVEGAGSTFSVALRAVETEAG